MPVIYFISNAIGDAVKVGVTSCLEKRLAQLQTANAGRLRVLGTIPGGRAEEKKFHARFAKYRLHGEWFRVVDEEPQMGLRYTNEVGRYVAEVLERYGIITEMVEKVPDGESDEAYMARKEEHERFILAETGQEVSIAAWSLSYLVGYRCPTQYSVDEESGDDDFWVWYLDNAYRLLPSMLAASRAFIRAYRYYTEFVRVDSPKPRKPTVAEWLAECFREQREWRVSDLKAAATEAGLVKEALFTPDVQSLPILKRCRVAPDGERHWVWIAEDDWPGDS